MYQKRRIFMTILISILTLFILSGNINAVETEKGDFSKVYLEWLELSDEDKANTIAPLPLNIRGNEQSTGLIDKIKRKLKSISIPSKYDLREHINVEVKDQKDTGECWAFTANTSIETYLALNNKTYNFSERHIDYDTADNYIDGKNENALKRCVGDGGYTSTAFTYYSRGSGPILEEDMPFINDETPIKLYELPKNDIIQKVDDMVYFPNVFKRWDENSKLIYTDANGVEYSDSEIKEIRNEIKKHIMQYGAVSTSISAPISNYNSYYHSSNVTDENTWANHAVTIIGWDDNFSKDKFDQKPSIDGAYIVLNSWGTEWGDQGVYYISYEDFLVEANIRGVTGVSDVEYDNLYQHDISEVGNIIKTKYAANVFECADNEKLIEIMVGCLSEEKCNIYISKNNNLNISNSKLIAENISLNPGYNTIKISENVNLQRGDKFAIIVELINEDFSGIGIEDNKTVNFGNAISNLGESFMSSDGHTWLDIYDKENMMNFSIKAYTQTDEKKVEATDVLGKAYEGFGGNYSFSIKTSYSEKNKEVTLKFYNESGTELNNFKIKGNKIKGNGSFIEFQCPKNLEAGTYYVDINLSSFDTITKTFNVSKIDDDKVLLQFNDENFLQYMYTKTKDSFVSYDSLQLIASQESIDNVTTLEDGYMKKIKDITGIQYYKNINEVNFNSNEITDIEKLKNLTNLKKLYLESNQISDFSSISDLTKLEELKIAGCKLENIDFLNKLNNLTVLDMKLCGSNERINIEKIFSLKNLEKLDMSAWYWIDENDLKDMYKLENLKFLALNGCNIGNITFLESLKLENLEIGNMQYLCPDGTLSEEGTNHFSDLTPLSEMYTLWGLNINKVQDLKNLNGLENLAGLECLWVEGGALRDANVLDSETFKNKSWSNLWLDGNQIKDIIEKTEETVVEIDVPVIIRQACNSESLLYSESGISLNNCEWKEYGKTIKIDTGKFSACYICINSGYAQGTQYSINVNIDDTDSGDIIEDLTKKIYIQFPDINLYNAIKSKTPFGGHGIEFECFDDENKIYISKNDIAYINYLDLSTMNIEDITGIENFTNLQTINLGYNNNLENVDVLSLLPQIKSIILNGTKVENIENLINKGSVEKIAIYKENLKVYADKEEKIELPKYIYQSLKLQEGVTATAVIYYDVLDTTRGGGGDFPINDYNNFKNVDICIDDEKETATIELDRSITSEKKRGIRAILVTMKEGKTSNSEYKCYYKVDKELTGISVNGYEANNYYFIEGENFNSDGLQVVANYNDKSSQEITDYQILNGENLRLGQESVIISYTEDGITKTTKHEINVTAKELTNITVAKAPTYTTYIEGENFNSAGMIVKAIYNDGTSKEVTNYTVTDGNGLTAGKTSVTISYTENGVTKTITQRITVTEKLQIKINEYTEIKEENGSYIENICPNTIIEDMISKIDTNGQIEIFKKTEKITDKSAKMATGMKIKITLNNECVEYIAVVKGDLTGDGEMGDIDLLRMARYKAGLDKNLTGAYLKAADINNNNENAEDIDLLKLVRILVGLDSF